MEKNMAACSLGDCPGLSNGPKSEEHEGRFQKRGGAESQMIKNSSSTMIKGGSAQNSAK